MMQDEIFNPRKGVENDARSDTQPKEWGSRMMIGETRPKEWGSKMMPDQILNPRNVVASTRPQNLSFVSDLLNPKLTVSCPCPMDHLCQFA